MPNYTSGDFVSDLLKFWCNLSATFCKESPLTRRRVVGSAVPQEKPLLDRVIAAKIAIKYRPFSFNVIFEMNLWFTLSFFNQEQIWAQDPIPLIIKFAFIDNRLRRESTFSRAVTSVNKIEYHPRVIIRLLFYMTTSLSPAMKNKIFRF